MEKFDYKKYIKENKFTFGKKEEVNESMSDDALLQLLYRLKWNVDALYDGIDDYSIVSEADKKKRINQIIKFANDLKKY